MSESGTYQMGPNVLLSIDPEWADAILDGEKRYEYRRVVPAKEAPMRFVLYASAPVQAAVGEVWSWKILRDRPIEELLDDTIRWTPHSREDVREYFEGVDTGNAIRIASSYRFENPVPRSGLVDMDLEPGQNFRYIGEAPALPPERYDLEQIRVEEPEVSTP